MNMTLGGTAFRDQRFTVVRELGAGGMGVVYDARDERSGGRVALKTLQRMDPHALLLFKDEFRSLAELSHPNLLPLYELCSDGREWFFTMELLEGAEDFLAWVRGERRAGAPTAATGGAGPSHSGPRTIDRGAVSVTLPAGAAGGAVGRADADATVREPPGGAVDRADADATVREPPESAAPSPADAFDAARARSIHLDEGRLRDALAQLAAGVDAIHRAGKLHRDLKPGNVLVEPSGRVRVLDFGLVFDLGRPTVRPASAAREGAAERQTGAPSSDGHAPTSISGTVGYMAPEQAAGEPLGPAADWYAVGAMLLLALTGRLPFEGSAGRVLLEKRMASAPAVRAIAPHAPADLADLADALLRTDPGARPRGDEVLARLAGSLPAPSQAAPSARAAVDDAALFVGRERELEALALAFRAVREGSTAVVEVRGRSGAGKSTLLAHFCGRLQDSGPCLVLASRCYEQESLPYKAVDGLLDAIARHLVRLPEPDRRTLLPAGMPALARVFPVLGRVVDRDAGDPQGALDARAVRTEAFHALGELLVRLARVRPVVVHIDDLQWGDADSAELLASVLGDVGDAPLLFLFGYRSEYDSRSACLKELAASRPRWRAAIRRSVIDVDVLPREATLRLARELLVTGGSADPDAAAQWIARASGGSALYVYELARHAAAGGARASGPASIDLDHVLYERVRALPAATRRFVEAVALAGRPTRLRHLRTAAGLDAIGPDLLRSVRAERLVRGTGLGLDDEVEPFHDRVRESVCARVPRADARAIHLELGRALEAAGEVHDDTAWHYEEAGVLAHAARLYLEGAEAAVRVLAFDRAERLLRKVVELAPSREEKADALERLVHLTTDLARFEDAYAAGREGALLLGVELPPRFAPPVLLKEIALAEAKLLGRTIASLAELPEAPEDAARTVRLVLAAAKAAYQIRPELCVTVCAKSVPLSLRHGNTPDAALGYMVYGAIFKGGVLGLHATGHAWGKLALAVVDRFQSDRVRAEVSFVVGYFGTSWLEPAEVAEALFERAYATGLTTGDLFHTGCACAGIVMSEHMRGVPAARIEERIDRYEPLLERHGSREPLGAIRAVRQALRSLAGRTASVGSLGDARYDEAAAAREAATFGSRHFAHYVHVARAQAALLAGDAERALAASRDADALADASKGLLHSAEHRLWAALAHARLAERTTGLARLGHRRSLVSAATAFASWARGCEANFGAKAALLAGERRAASGARRDALEAFERAVRLARARGQLPIEALAELGRARLDPGAAARRDARARAAAAFASWGAVALAERAATG